MRCVRRSPEHAGLCVAVLGCRCGRPVAKAEALQGGFQISKRCKGPWGRISDRQTLQGPSRAALGMVGASWRTALNNVA
eukprot:365639-Chlamydomonas_euryale.AAC.9